MKVVREYHDYSDYINHQQEKTLDPKRRKKWLGKEWKTKLKAFKEAFISALGNDLSGKRCLGICARTGQEIQAFKDLGADAIGIDIVPCKPLVIEGDMHNMPFPDNEFDIVFSNSFDHALHPEKVVKEVIRVIKPNSFVLFHLRFYTSSYEQRSQRKQSYDICEVGNSKEFIELFDDAEVLIDRECNYLSANREVLLKINKEL